MLESNFAKSELLQNELLRVQGQEYKSGSSATAVWLAWKSCAANAWWCWLMQLPEMKVIVYDVGGGLCAAAVGLTVLMGL